MAYSGIDTRPVGVSSRLRRLMSIHEGVRRRFLAQFDLQTGETEILGALRRKGPDFTLGPGELATHALVTPGAITNRLNQLETKGLITRRIDPENRRNILVTLTDEGKHRMDITVYPAAEMDGAFLSGLTEEEQDRLSGLLRKLLLAHGDSTLSDEADNSEDADSQPRRETRPQPTSPGVPSSVAT